MTGLFDERLAAALDLGTNTFLLLVGRAGADGGLEIVDDQCRTPRLGAGLAASGRLGEDAIERGLDVLAEYAQRLRSRRVDPSRVRAVGTAALRRASNSAEFLARARAHTGFEVEVIAADEEARLGYSAVAPECATRNVLSVDVGGGSTEIVARGGAPRWSAPIGAVVATEMHQAEPRTRAWSDAEWNELLDAVVASCALVPGDLAREPGAQVVVLGGTGANLACLDSGLARFDPHAIEGVRLGAQRAAEWAERLRRLDAAERCAYPLERERAVILPAGLACLDAALRRLGAAEVTITGRGLRHAVLRQLCLRRSER